MSYGSLSLEWGRRDLVDSGWTLLRQTVKKANNAENDRAIHTLGRCAQKFWHFSTISCPFLVLFRYIISPLSSATAGDATQEIGTQTDTDLPSFSLSLDRDAPPFGLHSCAIGSFVVVVVVVKDLFFFLLTHQTTLPY